MAGAHSLLPDPWLTLSAFGPVLRIVHQTPGRIRLKINGGAPASMFWHHADVDELRRSFGRVRGVRDLRLNPLARSCVIEYDTGIIPDAAWPDLLAGRHSEAARRLMTILQEKYAEVRESVVSPTKEN